MAIELLEGFDPRETLTDKWEGASALTLNAAGRHGYGAQATGSLTNAFKTLSAPFSQVFIGMAIKTNFSSGAHQASGGYIIMYSPTSVLETAVRQMTDGGLGIYKATGTLLAQTGPGLIVNGVWNYLEFTSTLHASTGYAEVKLNGATVLTFNGNTLTTGTTINRVGYGTQNGVTNQWDDMYICSNVGPTAATNTFLGDGKVEGLFPDGNGNSSQLLGSDGNSTDNYLLTDEVPPNTSDYVGSAVQGQLDTYAMSNLTGSPSTIKGVQVNTYAAKTDTGAKFYRPLIRTGGTNYAGTSVALGTSYQSRTARWDVNPNTGVAWTPAEINALEVGFEVRDS